MDRSASCFWQWFSSRFLFTPETEENPSPRGKLCGDVCLRYPPPRPITQAQGTNARSLGHREQDPPPPPRFLWSCSVRCHKTLPWSLCEAFQLTRLDRLLDLLRFLRPLTTAWVPVPQAH